MEYPVPIAQTLHHLGDILVERYRLCCDLARNTGVIEIDANQRGMRMLRGDPFERPADNGGGVESNTQLQKNKFSAGGVVDKIPVVALLLHPGLFYKVIVTPQIALQVITADGAARDILLANSQL